jgi:hypothetical protein
VGRGEAAGIVEAAGPADVGVSPQAARPAESNRTPGSQAFTPASIAREAMGGEIKRDTVPTPARAQNLARSW